MSKSLVIGADLVILAVFAGCIGIAAIGIRAARQPLRNLSSRSALSLISPFLFSVLIIVWGVIFWWNGPEDTEPRWRIEATSWLLFVIYPSLCAFSIWRSRGYRQCAAALIPLSLFCALFATAIAVACVTGD